MIIPHSKPTLGALEAKAVQSVIHSDFISQGKQVLAFESKFARFQKSAGAVALNCGTSALHLSLLALDVKKGDQVIVPSYVCTALLNAISYCGAKPVIVDVCRQTFNMNCIDAKKAITKKTKAIILPHMFGHPGNIKAINKLGVPVIEDCAQSIGATVEKKRVGSFAKLSIFSFYATKMMTTGEGGMITTNNKSLLAKIRDLRDYDHKADLKVRFNYKMTDMQAALGILQLAKLPKMIKERQRIAKLYDKAFQANENIRLPSTRDDCTHVYFRYIVKSKSASATTIIKKMKQKGITCEKPVFKPLHQYVGKATCKSTEMLDSKAVSIPIYPTLTTSQISKITKTLNLITRV